MHLLTFSIEEVQKATGIGRTKIYQSINSGQLPARKLGKRTLILKRDLENFLEGLEKCSLGQKQTFGED